MTRQLKRVPLDFAWPRNRPWHGYKNPHYKPCPAENTACFNGNTGAGQWFDAISRFIALVGEEGSGIHSVAEMEARRASEHAKRGAVYPHPYLTEFPTAPDYTIDHRRHLHGHVPVTDEFTQLTSKLSGKPPGHFDGNSHAVWNGLRKALDMPRDWGVCPVCKGEQLDPAVSAEYKAWKPTEPPTGEGFQLWGESAPRTPVFATLDALCAYCEDNVSTFGDNYATAEKWREMLTDGIVYHEAGGMVCIG